MSYTSQQIQDFRGALNEALGDKFSGMGVRMKTVMGAGAGVKLQITTRWDFDDEVNGTIDAIGKRVLGEGFNRASDVDYIWERPTRPGPEYVR